MSTSKPFRDIIIFSPRADLKDALRQEVKALDMGEIETPNTVEWVIEEIGNKPNSLIIVDWEAGDKTVVQLLEATYQRNLIDMRPVFLIARTLDQSIAAIANEYSVSQIHAGEISRGLIKDKLQRIIKLEESNAGLRSVIEKINVARKSDDKELEITLLTSLLNKLPDNHRVKAELCESYISSDKWDLALTLAEELASITPPYVRGIHLYGRCLMKTGDFKKAINYLSKAKTLNPLNLNRLVMLGNSHFANNDLENAKKSFEEAAAIDKRNSDVTQGMAKVKLVEGDVNEALELMSEVNTSREKAAVFNTAAIFSMRNGQQDDGMKLYDSAVTALGSEPKLLAKLMFNKGLGYKRMKDPDKADECFNKALEYDPDYKKAKMKVEEAASEDAFALKSEAVQKNLDNDNSDGPADSLSIESPDDDDEFGFGEDFDDESF